MTNLLTINEIIAAKKKFIDLVRTKKNVVNPQISFTDLRGEAMLSHSKNSYKIGLKKVGSTQVSELEQKMDDTFLFMPLMVAINIQKTRKTTTATAPDYDGNFPLFTYPDRGYFLGKSGALTEANALEKIYQGLFSFQKGGNDLGRQVTTHHMKYVPNQQYMDATSSPTGYELFPEYGPTDAKRGYHPLHTDFVLEGAEDNNVVLELGSGNIELIAGGLDASGTAVDTSNKLVILTKGFLWYGSDFGNSSGFCAVNF